MAEFTSFDAPARVTGTISVDKATADTFGGGQGLITAGKTITGFAGLLEQRAERSAGLHREETIADDRLFAAKRLQELKDTLPNGGEGAFEILKGELEQRRQKNSEGMSTLRSRESYGLQSKQLQASFLAQAVGVEAQATAFAEKQIYEKVLGSSVNSVRANPTMESMFQNLEQVKRLVEASRLTGKNKQKFRQKAIEDLYAAQADGILSPDNVSTAEEAEFALGRIKGEEFKNNLSKEAYDQNLGRAQALVAQHNSKEQTAAARDISTRITEVRVGKATVNLTPEEIVASIKDVEVASKLVSNLKQARREGAWNRSVGGASTLELDVMQKDLDKRAAVEGELHMEERQQAALDRARGKLRTAERQSDLDSLENLAKLVPLIKSGVANDSVEARRIVAGINDSRVRRKATKEIDKAEDIKLGGEFNDRLIKKSQGIFGADVTKEDIAKLHNPVTRKKFSEASRRAGEIAGIRKTTATGSKVEVRTLQVKLITELNSLDAPEEAAQELEAFKSALAVREAALANDKVGYVMQRSEVVQAAINAHAAAPDETTRKELSDALSSEQIRMGVSPREVYLLPKDLVENIRVQTQGVTRDADGAQKTRGIIDQVRAESGRDWPLVMKQLKEQKVFSGATLVAAGMRSPGEAEDLILANSTPKKDIDAGLGAEPVKVRGDIAKEVAKHLADFKGTVLGVPGGLEAFGTQRDAIQKYAEYLVADRGLSQADAVKKAGDSVIGHYQIEGSIRVPDNAGVTAEKVVEITSRAVNFMNFGKMKLPPSQPGITKDVVQSRYRRNLEATGKWITNHDETGVVFVDEYSTPVLFGDKEERMELNWDEINYSNVSGAKNKFK